MPEVRARTQCGGWLVAWAAAVSAMHAPGPPARAQAPVTTQPSEGTVRVLDPSVLRSRGAPGTGTGLVPATAASRRGEIGAGLPRAIAATEGNPSPGQLLTLKGDQSLGAAMHRWIQTQGPPVALDDPTSATPRLKVPPGARALGFALVVANAKGTDVANLVIRVAGRAPAGGDPQLEADAGDDQLGIVGRQVTLNGARSVPRDQVGYRWLQVAGPRVRLELEDGYIYSFVPQAPGVYQFALIVARGSELSRPDLVTVSVGNPASPFGIQAAPEPPEALHDVARAALAQVPGGLDLGPALAETFDGVADRMDLYHSYAEAYSELSRRLATLLPNDPVRRGVWDERLFAPLAARLVEGLRREGLDLRLPDGPATPLTSVQRARLAELFRAMSQGFRASRPGS